MLRMQGASAIITIKENPVIGAYRCFCRGGRWADIELCTWAKPHVCSSWARMRFEQHNGIFFFFFAVKEWETSESGGINDLTGRGQSWGFLLRATNGWSHLKQAAADKERVNPPENTWPLWDGLNSLNSLSSYFLLVLMTLQIKTHIHVW